MASTLTEARNPTACVDSNAESTRLDSIVKEDPHYVQNQFSEAFHTEQNTARAIAKYRKVQDAFNKIQDTFDDQLEADVVALLNTISYTYCDR